MKKKLLILIFYFSPARQRLLALTVAGGFLILNYSFAQTISGGTHHSLALCSDSTVRAWGANLNGQLGNGTTSIFSNVPVQVSALSGVTAIGGGGQLSLALKNDGTVRAWGANFNGQLGNGTNTDSNVPVQVSALSGITAIAGGGNSHSLALKNDGTVWAWGANAHGQLGNGTNTGSNVPVQVSVLSGITGIAAGNFHSLALKNDGTVWIWGGNSNNVPVQMSALSGIIVIAGGGEHFFALKNDGTVWAWGRNDYGMLGNGTNTASNVPVQVIALCQVSTGVEEENIVSTINIFPNPATSEFRIQNAELRIEKVEMFDVFGKCVYNSAFDIHHSALTIDVSSLAPGIYFVKLISEQGSVTRKVVVQR